MFGKMVREIQWSPEEERWLKTNYSTKPRENFNHMEAKEAYTAANARNAKHSCLIKESTASVALTNMDFVQCAEFKFWMSRDTNKAKPN